MKKKFCFLLTLLLIATCSCEKNESFEIETELPSAKKVEIDLPKEPSQSDIFMQIIMSRFPQKMDFITFS